MVNVVWLSANEFGYRLLETAIDIECIEAIITLKENAKTVIYDKPKKSWECLGRSIPIYKIEDINKEGALLKKLAPDLIVMCGWRQIIKKEILDIPKKGVIGFHPTLLPKGRGPAPIINSILNGVKRSGVTMFHVKEGVDNGDIIGQETFTIREDYHADDVYNEMIFWGKRLLDKYLLLLSVGKAPRTQQNEEEATTFNRRSVKDNEIDLEKESAEEIYKKIRAFSKPYLGAYIKKDGKKLIIWRAELQ